MSRVMGRPKSRNRRIKDAEPRARMAHSPAEAAEAQDRPWSAVLLAAAALVLWALPATSSFWLDETATYWVVKDGIGGVLTRPMYWSGQSPLYYVTAWAAFLAGGN